MMEGERWTEINYEKGERKTRGQEGQFERKTDSVGQLLFTKHVNNLVDHNQYCCVSFCKYQTML